MRRRRVCGGEAAYSINIADHCFHSEESILRFDGAGQGPHLCSELAGSHVVTGQGCAVGVPCIAQPPRIPPKGVQQERLECSMSAGSQDVPGQDFAGAPFSAKLPQVQPKSLQHDLVDHSGIADSQVKPFLEFAVGELSRAISPQESLCGMQRESLECSACVDNQDLTSQDLASGRQAHAQGMQRELARSSLFGEGCVDLTCQFDLEHEDWLRRPWTLQDCTAAGLVQGNC